MRNDLIARINRFTLYIFAAAGLIAAVAGTLIDLPWVSKNISSILLFELSALLAFLLMELGSIGGLLRDIRGQSREVRTFDTPESLYRMAAATLRETFEQSHANKSVWVTSATGIPYIRSPRALNPSEREYYRALAAVIKHTGWSVRILYHIESIERLEWVHRYLADMSEAVDLEARALVHTAQEMIAPLIVGDDHVFLAQGDRRFYAVRAGIWVKEPSANLFARSYFESLWQGSDLRVLRRATGLDEETFMAIRLELSTQITDNRQP